MAKGISNTSRTLEYIRSQGWICDRAEHWNHYAKCRMDLFGFIDVVALGERKTWGIQSCGEDFASHNQKILSEPNALKWLESESNRIMLIGWRKVKLKRGGKAMRWAPRIKEYSKEDFMEVISHGNTKGEISKG